MSTIKCGEMNSKYYAIKSKYFLKDYHRENQSPFIIREDSKEKTVVLNISLLFFPQCYVCNSVQAAQAAAVTAATAAAAATAAHCFC